MQQASIERKKAFALAQVLNQSDFVTGTKPFLKWVGGKSQIIEKIGKNIPEPHAYKRYIEPFLGGGAVFFKLIPAGKEAILGDINNNLIGAFLDIKNKSELVIAALQNLDNRFKNLSIAEKEKFYYKKRSQYNKIRTSNSSVIRTALLIFLNKTCYNGVYRENAKGEFNVPFGENALRAIFDNGNIIRVSEKLRNANIKQGSYKEILKFARKGDLIYLDPPYDPVSKTANFTTYHRNGFSELDQRELSAVCKALDEKGCFVLMSNSKTDLIKSLYPSSRWSVITIDVNRNINCKGQLRKGTQEVLIKNF